MRTALMQGFCYRSVLSVSFNDIGLELLVVSSCLGNWSLASSSFKFQVQVSSLFKLIYYKFMTSILQSLEYETYDVPLLAVSYSYSRRAVV